MKIWTKPPLRCQWQMQQGGLSVQRSARDDGVRAEDIRRVTANGRAASAAAGSHNIIKASREDSRLVIYVVFNIN